MPTSPAYRRWRLSNTSWKRNAQPTGISQSSAKRSKSQAESGVQPLPPTIANGRSDRISNWRNCSIACGSGCACTGTICGNTGAAVGADSMSSGNASTTGPGRPCIAVRKARATYSGRRSGECTSPTHFARPSVPGPNIWR